ncbi:hypothetical protein [Streptomyces sp. NPDC001665]
MTGDAVVLGLRPARLPSRALALAIDLVVALDDAAWAAVSVAVFLLVPVGGGTLVVRERVPAGRAAAVPPPPPWLVGRFAGLDLSAVPDELWLEVRQYLTRMHQLDAAVGGSMAERLGGEIAARTGAPPPPGVPAAAYLAAVVHGASACHRVRAALLRVSGRRVGIPGLRARCRGRRAPRRRRGGSCAVRLCPGR